jgi:hypothetical protein
MLVMLVPLFVLSVCALAVAAVGITADNAYAGLAGEYIVRDCDSRTESQYMPHDK